MNPRSWLRSLLFDNTTPRPERRGQRSRSRSRRANAISPRLETLEDRLAPATISISDASAAEGASALKFIDRFVADGSGGLSSSRLSTFGPDGNGDGVQDFYVTSGLTDQILRYDGRNGAFLDVFVGSGSGGLDDPHGVAFGPSDGMLYVSSYGSHDVLRYNGATGAFVDRVASGLSQPLGLTFGNDGNLYIADHGAHKILRYNSSSGLLSDFVSARSGGLDSPYRPAFGPDGNLYLGSAGTKQVLRYDGQTGAFLDVFASTSVASQGRGPAPIAFGPDGYLYTTARPTPTCCDTSIIRFDASNGAFVDSYTLGRDGWAFILGPDGLVYDSANSSGGFVDRFGSSSLAAFTVKLDSPSATPVTVNYATASGTALAGSDFTAVSGTVTFAPGQTSQTILVNTIDNSALEPVETFVVNLSNPSGATIADGQAVGTILDNDGVPNPSGPTISIGNVAATEGSSAMNFIDDFVSADSGGVSQPRGALIGPDGNLYVASFVSDQILKYDARNGAFLGVFVATGSGGLDGPWAMVFGPDGNGDQVNDLYVGSEFSHSILRYNGVTGEFIDAFVPSGGYGRLVKPKGLTFGPDGHLYVSSGQTTPTFWPWEVLRFDGQTGAFLDIFVTNGSGGLANPNDLRFGPDGSLYVTSNHTDQILRYNGVTGAFVDAFVPAGSGGLDNPTFLEFRPDGLYVAGQFSNSVTRYNPATGAYIDTPVPTGSGGLSNPFCFVFDSTGALLVGSTNTNQILRYSPASQAAFKVTLSAPSATEITVDYSTSNGTAVAGSDYQQSLYTLKFAPGVTTRTILVPTLDDTIAEPTETFTVNLSNVSGGTIADGQGVGSILDNEIATQFYVVNDGLSDQTYRYSAGGASLATTNLGSSNTAPRGAASNVAGDRIWVADANKAVYVYNPAGTLLGSWTAGSLASNAEVEGFATNGTDVWIVDSRQDKVFKYTGAASRLSGSQNAASSFNLAGGNNNPKGIVTDGTSIWVVNDGGTDKVYKYTMTGALLGSWTITGAGSTPTGITLDPTGPGHLWVVDGGTDRVYEYSGALTRISGSQSPSSNFVLAAGNSNPQDIADPVGAGVSLAPTATTLTSGSANPAAPAQALTFTATVTGGADGEVVELHDNTNDGAVIATAQLSGGSAAFSVPASALALGKHELAAVYPGTGAKAPSLASFSQFISDIPPAALARSHFPDDLADQTFGQFGSATAVDGDYYVVGMPYADIGGVTDAGVAYVYNRSTGALVATLDNPSPSGVDDFAAAVAISGNLVVVGASDFGAGFGGVGKAYVFSATTGAVLATLTNPDPADAALFGFSVAISGNRAFVGSIAWTLTPGQVFVFDALTGALTATLESPAGTTDDVFGLAVAASGSTVLVGAPGGPAGTAVVGRAYVFDAATEQLIATLDDPAADASDFFGLSVGLWGNAAVVGAPDDKAGGSDSGQAYVFNATTGALLTTLTNPSPAADDHFGDSVAISGHTALVGTPSDDTGATNSGQAYVFHALTGDLLSTLTNPSPASGDGFGASVAIAGNTAVIGTTGDDTANTNQGAAYVFTTIGPPVVTGVAPFVGPTTGGNTVVISGLNFLSVSGAAGVQFGGANATVYSVDSPTKITAVVPPGVAGVVEVTVTSYGMPSSTEGTANDFTYGASAPPAIASVIVNGNIASLAGAQRSRVASLVVMFDQAVQMDADALTLALHLNNVTFNNVAQPDGYGSLPTSLNVTTTDNKTWIVTFAGNTDTGTDGFPSLKDGVYDLKIDAAKVHPLGVPEVSMTAHSTTTFHRLFGDVNNAATPAGGTPGTDFQAVLNTGDNLAFRQAFNNPANYKAYLDFNGDSVINSGDNLQFRNRFNKSLTWRV